MTARLACLFWCTFQTVGAQETQRIPRQDLTPKVSVEGMIHSTDGPALGGVRLVLQDAVSGKTTEGVSSGQGVVLLRDLAPGTYAVLASLDGFETYSDPAVLMTGARIVEV